MVTGPQNRGHGKLLRKDDFLELFLELFLSFYGALGRPEAPIVFPKVVIRPTPLVRQAGRQAGPGSNLGNNVLLAVPRFID